MSRRRSCCCGGGGSGEGSPGSGGIFTCCEEVLGPFSESGVWPDPLFLTISGACCSPVNGTYTIVKTGFGYNWGSMFDCTNVNRGVNGTLYCTDNRWYIDAVVTGAADVLNCADPMDPDTRIREMVLLSCDPFHAYVDLPICTGSLGLFCNGILRIDITE